MAAVAIAAVLVAGLLGFMLLRKEEQQKQPSAAQQIGAGIGSLLAGILAAAGVGGGS